MTIRFAAAWGGATPAITRALCPSAPLGAANDNRRTMALHDAACARTRIRATPQHDPHLLSEALRHFGRFGLGAAAQARSEAEQAAISTAAWPLPAPAPSRAKGNGLPHTRDVACSGLCRGSRAMRATNRVPQPCAHGEFIGKSSPPRGLAPARQGFYWPEKAYLARFTCNCELLSFKYVVLARKCGVWRLQCRFEGRRARSATSAPAFAGWSRPP